MNRKQYDIEYGGNQAGDWDTNVGDILYTKDGPDTPVEKKESVLTVWHWCTIVICIFIVIIGIVYNDPLISIGAFLTGYFEIRTALLYHDIQQLQERVKSLENKQI